MNYLRGGQMAKGKRGRPKGNKSQPPVPQRFIQKDFYGESWKSQWHIILSDMYADGFKFLPPIFKMGRQEQMATENGVHPELYLITFEKVDYYGKPFLADSVKIFHEQKKEEKKPVFSMEE